MLYPALHVIQCNTIKNNIPYGGYTTWRDTMQCNVVQRSAVPCNAMQCSTVQRIATQRNAAQCHATQRNAMQCIAIHLSEGFSISSFQFPIDALYFIIGWWNICNYEFPGNIYRCQHCWDSSFAGMTQSYTILNCLLWPRPFPSLMLQYFLIVFINSTGSKWS